MRIQPNVPRLPRHSATQAKLASTPKPSKTELVQVFGPDDQASQLELGEEPVTIGRDREAAYRIQDLNVSRQHAQMKKVDGQIYVRDIGSTNGTYVNGEAIRKGEWVAVGEDHHLSFGTNPSGALHLGKTKSNRACRIMEGRSEGGQHLPLPTEGSEITWGRKPENGIQIPQKPNGERVSRKHVKIRKNAGKYWVKDLSSTNGTYLGNNSREPIKAGEWVEVQLGDKISLGPEYQVVLGAIQD